MVFKFFEEISAIPRESGNERAISDYLVAFAKTHSLDFIRDEFNNVIIRKPGTVGYETSPTVILQGHVDMVCVKTETSTHNFLTDPIELIRDGDYIRANGTSLGADDGIGVSYALAVLASNDIAHPPLEAVFTVDEENTMSGAQMLDKTALHGKILLNIDGENEQVFIVGSGGATDTAITCPITRQENHNPALKLKLSGLKGGHSAAEIDKELGNAIVLLMRMINILRKYNVALSEIKGGERTNVIPSLSEAVITFDESRRSQIVDEINSVVSDFKNEYKATEPGLTFTMSEANAETVLTDESLSRVVSVVLLIPNGVINKNLGLNNLVETSNNIGTIATHDNEIVIGDRFRSSVQSRSDFIFEQIKAITEMNSVNVEVLTTFPAWDYNTNSKLLDTCKKLYSEMFNREPIIEATHGGIECSYFKQIPGIDMICFGPNIYDYHSFNEKVSVSSVERFWLFLKQLLSELK